MNVLLSLSLWFAVVMMSSCGSAGSHEEQTTTEFYDYPTETVTPTPDYDYTATFDYFFVTGHYPAEVKNQASGIGPFSLVLLLGLAVHQMWN